MSLACHNEQGCFQKIHIRIYTYDMELDFGRIRFEENPGALLKVEKQLFQMF